MADYKLNFKLDYKFLCWGIPESELSGAFEQNINLDGGGEFNLKYQRKPPFNVSPIKEDSDGKYVLLNYSGKQLILRLNVPCEFYYKEDFEEYTDCNTGVYSGTVVLEKN